MAFSSIPRVLLARLLEWYGGGRGLFVPIQSGGASRVGRVVVLSAGRSPTPDVYLQARLQNWSGTSVQYVDVAAARPGAVAFTGDELVIVVRSVPRDWLKRLERQQAHLAGVVYLLDDDMPSALHASDLPFFYALRTAWRYAMVRRHLARLCSEIWVSTPELARRYPASLPKLCEPVYLAAAQSTDENPVVYFYHGTWAHRREIEWLVAVVKEVQASFPTAWFEIMGADNVRRLFRGIPRVRVIHPMPWRDYLAYAGTVSYQVGLAPCFDTDFNRARSHVKLFDITRLGAAGVYSDVIPYSEKVLHGETGWLCENTHEAWVTAIGNLILDPRMRDALFQQARAWCEKTRENVTCEGLLKS